MTHDPLPPLTPEEGGLHGDIPDTPEARAWFQELGEKAQTATHDPLCARTPTGVHYVGTCTCDLIAKVRADTLDSAAQRVEKNVLIGMTLTPKEVRTILAALRGES